MNTIIISLERAPERRERIQLQIDSLSLSHIIMDAVDGAKLSEEDLNKKICLPGGYRFGELFKPGEIGCTMSHIKALEIAIDKKWDYVIVLEDDVIIAEDIEKRIKLLFKILPADWDHVYLSGIPKIPPQASSILFPNIQPSVFTECTHSMMINGGAFDKIIERLSRFETTTDDIYCDMIKKNYIHSYTYYPFVTYAKDDYTYIWDQKITREHKSKQYFKNKI